MKNAIALSFLWLFLVISGCANATNNTKTDEMEQYYINLWIPFSDVINLDIDLIMGAFEKTWSKKIIVGEADDLFGSKKEGIKNYLVLYNDHTIRLKYEKQPIPEDLSKLVLQTPNLNNDSKRKIKHQKSHIMVEYLMGSDDAKERIRISAMVLISLLNINEAIGYVNTSAMVYRPKNDISYLLKKDNLDSIDLFQLFIKTELVSMQNKYWMHTHGMEQFDCPDIQILYNDNNTSYNEKLISNAAIYMINRGAILNPGNSIELNKDGKIWKIESVKANEDHNFGQYGAIEIKPL